MWKPPGKSFVFFPSITATWSNIESRYVNLGQELDHIENFLKLQKIRFPRKLDYEILCEDGIDIVPIPPFLLESFIGNSLKYGQDEQEKL